MSATAGDLDLTAAVDAAARARYERVRQSRLLYETPPAWHDLAPQHQHGWREGVLNEVAAAAPLIAAQVAEQIAAAIEAERPSDEEIASNAPCSAGHGCHEAAAYAAYSLAARIAREAVR